MIPKNVETLKNMNSTTAKFAKWYVRIQEPTVFSYTFASRGETVPAQKSQCLLVSKDPAEYMIGAGAV